MAKLMTKRIEQSLLQHPLSSQDGKKNRKMEIGYYSATVASGNGNGAM